jgi:hypothetical protein
MQIDASQLQAGMELDRQSRIVSGIDPCGDAARAEAARRHRAGLAMESAWDQEAQGNKKGGA